MLIATLLSLLLADHLVTVDMLELTRATTAQGKVDVNHLCVGGDMHINGKVHWRGYGVAAPSTLETHLGGGCRLFRGVVGMADGPKGGGTAVFRIFGDGKLLWDSGKVTSGDPEKPFELALAGVDALTLDLSDAGDGNAGDLGCWASPQFIFEDGHYPANDVRNHSPQLGVLTPKPASAPRINTAPVFGVRPGRPVLYRVGVTGERPLEIEVRGAAELGLAFDRGNQSITGPAPRQAGIYPLEIVARNAKGTATRTLRLVVGEKISLTPAMGWNSWNCFTENVNQEKIESAAKALIDSGLAEHGWQYIVTDDYWARSETRGKTDPTLAGPVRSADGTILPNARFPSMKGLANRIHALGLKAGLYSAPGILTCGFCAGSWAHEEQDARTFADWGFDFLKYDWCYYPSVAMGKGLDRAMYPYLTMGMALRTQKRDILFSLCQYGMENVSAWGALAYGQSWRTTGDVQDVWSKIAAAIEKQKRLFFYSAPGAFNDPDMLCVGKANFNAFMGSRLAPNEQYTHISLWALVAAPLMIGCDLTRLDDFTYGLLANDEVIAIDQDELGLGAGCVAEGTDWEIWARPLADGAIAVGLYNKALKPQKIKLDLEGLGLEGTWNFRDVWRQTDEGSFAGAYAREVFGHATHLLRLTPCVDAGLRSNLADVRDNAWLLMKKKDSAQKK